MTRTVLPPAVAAIAASIASDPLQFVTIAIGLAVALAVGRSKQKDSTITDLKNALEVEEKLHAQTARERDGAALRAETERTRRHEERDRRHSCEQKIASLEGQLETLQRYAAPEAFKEIAAELVAVRTTMAQAISSQGELILKNTELASGAITALEQVTTELGNIAERLASMEAEAAAERDRQRS